MILIAPLFGIVQAIYYFGIAEYLMGIVKTKKGKRGQEGNCIWRSTRLAMRTENPRLGEGV